MKMAFFETEPWQKGLLKKAFPKDKLFFSEKKLTSRCAKKYKGAEVLSVFIYSKINQTVLDQFPKLKLITTMSTGFDHIDLQTCKERGIYVCNVPTYGANTVAEHAFALLIGISRKIIKAVRRVKEGSYDRTGLRGIDLKGKTLGVVGTGNIGKFAVKIGKGYGMNIIAFDVFKDQKFAKKMDFKYVSLEKLFKLSDIITLHVPYNKHTHHLINYQLLSKLKDDSYLINTSRGGILDTLALLRVLKSGKLLGVGLDVQEEESALMEESNGKKGEHWKKANKKIIAANHVLMKMNNVLITPHNAYNTDEALMRILNTTIENIKGYKKKKFVNLVKLK